MNCCRKAKRSPVPDAAGYASVYIYDGTSKVPYNVSEVKVAGNVTELGNHVFACRVALTVITIPQSITKIGNSAFAGCVALEKIVIPPSITELRDGMFQGCEALRAITIPHSVTKIGDYAFFGCEALETMTIPPSVTELRDGVFKMCEALTSITIPPSVTIIGNEVFMGCKALATVAFLSSVPKIGAELKVGNNVFYGCEALENVTGINVASDASVYIYDGTCEVPNTATKVEIADTVTELGDEVFKDCKVLITITIPPSITKIDYQMFNGCLSLENVILSEGSMTDLPNHAFYGMSLKTITIPSSITKVGDWAFGGCEYLEAVTIKSSTLELGDGVFWGCKNLSVIEMPQSITLFGNGVFSGCRKLPSNEIDEFCHQQASNIRLTGPGSDLEFRGKAQNGWGPEWWGVSLEQIQKMKEHPNYNRTADGTIRGKKNYLMRDYVQSVIEPLTDGTGMGYALLINQENPLKARVMVSHAWDEPICDFVEAIERAEEEGPFWICALSIYQNNNPSKGVTIADQLGPDPKFGPFATVLRQAELMLAVLTHECDIYTRLWCVYELFFAGTKGVKVRLAPHIDQNSVLNGNVGKDIGINKAIYRVKSIDARCGRPGSEMNDDEIAIRKEINGTDGGFNLVDEVIEKIRLVHLLSYPMEKIENKKIKAHDKMRISIESLILRVASNTKLNTFENFLSKKLTHFPGFKRIDRNQALRDDKYDYIISYGGTEYDVFKEWCSYLHDAIPNINQALRDDKHDYIISYGGTEYSVFKDWCSSLHNILPKS